MMIIIVIIFLRTVNNDSCFAVDFLFNCPLSINCMTFYHNFRSVKFALRNRYQIIEIAKNTTLSTATAWFLVQNFNLSLTDITRIKFYGGSL